MFLVPLTKKRQTERHPDRRIISIIAFVGNMQLPVLECGHVMLNMYVMLQEFASLRAQRQLCMSLDIPPKYMCEGGGI